MFQFSPAFKKILALFEAIVVAAAPLAVSEARTHSKKKKPHEPIPFMTSDFDGRQPVRVVRKAIRSGRGTTYVVEKFSRRGALLSRTSIWDDAIVVEVDRNGDGFLDQWEAFSDTSHLVMRAPRAGHFTEMAAEVIRGKHRTQMAFARDHAGVFRLARKVVLPLTVQWSTGGAGGELKSSAPAQVQEASAISDSADAGELQDINSKEENADVKKSLGKKLIDPASCGNSGFKKDYETMSTALTELLAPSTTTVRGQATSGKSRRSRYVQCMRSHGLTTKADAIEGRMYRKLKSPNSSWKIACVDCKGAEGRSARVCDPKKTAKANAAFDPTPTEDDSGNGSIYMTAPSERSQSASEGASGRQSDVMKLEYKEKFFHEMLHMAKLSEDQVDAVMACCGARPTQNGCQDLKKKAESGEFDGLKQSASNQQSGTLADGTTDPRSTRHSNPSDSSSSGGGNPAGSLGGLAQAAPQSNNNTSQAPAQQTAPVQQAPATTAPQQPTAYNSSAGGARGAANNNGAGTGAPSGTGTAANGVPQAVTAAEAQAAAGGAAGQIGGTQVVGGAAAGGAASDTPREVAQRATAEGASAAQGETRAAGHLDKSDVRTPIAAQAERAEAQAGQAPATRAEPKPATTSEPEPRPSTSQSSPGSAPVSSPGGSSSPSPTAPIQASADAPAPNSSSPSSSSPSSQSKADADRSSGASEGSSSAKGSQPTAMKSATERAGDEPRVIAKAEAPASSSSSSKSEPAKSTAADEKKEDAKSDSGSGKVSSGASEPSEKSAKSEKGSSSASTSSYSAGRGPSSSRDYDSRSQRQVAAAFGQALAAAIGVLAQKVQAPAVVNPTEPQGAKKPEAGAAAALAANKKTEKSDEGEKNQAQVRAQLKPGASPGAAVPRGPASVGDGKEKNPAVAAAKAAEKGARGPASVPRAVSAKAAADGKTPLFKGAAAAVRVKAKRGNPTARRYFIKQMTLLNREEMRLALSDHEVQNSLKDYVIGAIDDRRKRRDRAQNPRDWLIYNDKKQRMVFKQLGLVRK